MNAKVANPEPTGLSRYTLAAERSSAEIISTYSTSFGWASKLLGNSVRQQVRNIYALVRVADGWSDFKRGKVVSVPGALYKLARFLLRVR